MTVIMTQNFGKKMKASKLYIIAFFPNKVAIFKTASRHGEKWFISTRTRTRSGQIETSRLDAYQLALTQIKECIARRVGLAHAA